MKTKTVWVEMRGVVWRIFKSEKAAFAAPGATITEMPRADAVSSVRHSVWLRCQGDCADCAAPITEDSGHMHERKHRGKGGEVSVENSVFICPRCHDRAHSDRKPRFGKKIS